ncbi:MAG: lytic murein transglycosylase B [Cyclobacteriaceae bacterium]
MLKWTSLILLWTTSLVAANAQIDQSKVDQFIRDFSKIQNRSIDEVQIIIGQAEYIPGIIEKMNRPAEKMTWERYRKIFIQEDRINAGVQFWSDHESTLNQVYDQTGVAKEIILGIIGVESKFGQNKGTYKVLDALYTLAFAYPRRGSFFRKELSEFLILCEEESLNPLSIKGSYAGAIGFGQFMPSSYRAYAKSFDEGGTRDLVNSPEDAIASTASYLDVHRWETDGIVAIAAKQLNNALDLSKQSLKPKNTLAYYEKQGYQAVSSISKSESVTLIQLEISDGFEYWFGANNFYVITRYNHSPLYAMAVYQLAEAIKEKRQSASGTF